MTVFANPHDLLELTSATAVREIAHAPDWVEQSLSACCYAVVRRKQIASNHIAIGIRGKERSQRWAGSINVNDIKMVIRPFEIRTKDMIKHERSITIPALQNLQTLEAKWSELEFRWGPGGSVGFELATGFPAATQTSDLDIVLFAPQRFSQTRAQELFLAVREIGNTIDVLVEAPACAFSLAEYASAEGQSIMLRSCGEPSVGTDPWNFSQTISNLPPDGEKLETHQ
jgi:phosphoribosyl-dephospho-CoA transferase